MTVIQRRLTSALWKAERWGRASDVAPFTGNTRDSLVYGTYKPQAGTTAGLSNPSATFTTQGSGGSISLTTANAIYTNVIFNGQVVIGALGLQFFNCQFLGPTGAQTGPVASVRGNGAAPTLGLLGGARFVDCLFDPQVQTWWTYAITTSWYTMERCEVRHCVDGLSIGGATTTSQPTYVYGCHIHDRLYYSWVPPETGDGHSDNQTHSDGIQIGAGKNIRIKGNNIGGVPGATFDVGTDFNNSCIMLGQGVNNTLTYKIEDIIIELNYFSGGTASVNVVRAFGNTLDSAQILNNQFAVHPAGSTAQYYLVKPDPQYFGGVMSGNVFEGTSTPVPYTRGSAGS